MTPIKALILSAAFSIGSGACAQDTASLEAMQDYLMFAEPQAGIILPRQIDRDVFEAATFIDTRSAEENAEGTIAGARHIEWREVLDRIDEIPESGLTILFCNTGMRSAQATFALRVAGRDNVVVIQGGLDNWRETAAYRP